MRDLKRKSNTSMGTLSTVPHKVPRDSSARFFSTTDDSLPPNNVSSEELNGASRASSPSSNRGNTN